MSLTFVPSPLELYGRTMSIYDGIFPVVIDCRETLTVRFNFQQVSQHLSISSSNIPVNIRIPIYNFTSVACEKNVSNLILPNTRIFFPLYSSSFLSLHVTDGQFRSDRAIQSNITVVVC